MKKKTLVIALILVAMLATLAIGFVGCGKSLDGDYLLNDGAANVKIRISGNTIQYIMYGVPENGKENEIAHEETTFVKEKDNLLLSSKLYDLYEITIKDNTLYGKYKSINGKEHTISFEKVIDKK